jgi:hypothetical protein
MGLRRDRLKDLVRGLFRTKSVVLGVAGAAALLAGCGGGSGPEDAIKQLSQVDYGKPYIGMSKAEVLRCAGQPRSRIPAGSTAETLIYHYSGPGPVPGGGENAECTASLTFDRDKLARVSYAHMNVRSPYQWQSERDPKKAEELRRTPVPTCTFSLPRCPR